VQAILEGLAACQYNINQSGREETKIERIFIIRWEGTKMLAHRIMATRDYLEGLLVGNRPATSPTVMRSKAFDWMDTEERREAVDLLVKICQFSTRQ